MLKTIKSIFVILPLVLSSFLFASPAEAAVASAPRSLTSSPSVQTAALGWTTPSSNGGKTIKDYIVQYKLSTSTAWTTLNDGVNTKRAVTISGLTGGKLYNFRVAAKNSSGLSRYATGSFTTKTGLTSEVASLSSEYLPNNQVHFTWAAPATTNGGTLSGYKIEYKPSTATDFITLANTSSSSYTGELPITDALVDFRVTGITQFGIGAYSSNLQLINPSQYNPQNVASSLITKNGVKIVWEAPLQSPPDMAGYYVLINGTDKYFTTNTYLQLNNLTNATVYSFYVGVKFNSSETLMYQSGSESFETKPIPPSNIYGDTIQTLDQFNNTVTVNIPVTTRIDKVVLNACGFSKTLLGDEVKAATTNNVITVSVKFTRPVASQASIYCGGNVYIYNESGSTYDSFGGSYVYGVPSKPSNIRVSFSGTTATIRWDRVYFNTSQYFVYQEDGTIIAKVSENSGGQADYTNLVSGQTYKIYITAYNGIDGLPAEFSFTMP